MHDNVLFAVGHSDALLVKENENTLSRKMFFLHINVKKCPQGNLFCGKTLDKVPKEVPV